MMQLKSTLKAEFNKLGAQAVVLPKQLTSLQNKILPVGDGETELAPAGALEEIAHSITVPENSRLMFPDQQYNDDFLRTMSSVVRWSRWCGALAGGGTRATRSWACCIAALLGAIIVVIFVGLFRELAIWTFRNKETGAVSLKMAGLMFYLNSLGTVVLTWRLGTSWRVLTTRWAAADRVLASYMPQSETLRKNMLAMVTVITVGSLEQYAWWWGAMILVMSNVATVLWNLQDLVIMLLSAGLSSRYRRLNAFAADIVQRCEQQSIACGSTFSGSPQRLWRAAREGFARQAALVRLVDEALGPLMLLSFLNNFYFICYQMYNGISSVEGALQRSYFIISLFWLCARAAGVVLAASAVHYNSRGALTYTHACPSLHFTVEVHRLQTQLSKDQVALTGMQFFEITRSFLLKVVGAIITYEVVLVQFNENACN